MPQSYAALIHHIMHLFALRTFAPGQLYFSSSNLSLSLICKLEIIHRVSALFSLLITCSHEQNSRK